MCMFGLNFNILKTLNFKVIHIRCLYGIYHNQNRQIFYIKLNENDRAVLLYQKNNNIMDMRSINVPQKYQGQGLARMLAEAALTYAIVHNYKIILTCNYMQKFYLATRTPELTERIIGPQNILKDSGSLLLHPETIDELQDPQDNENSKGKN